VRELGIDYRPGNGLIFELPMPKSWSKKKRDAMRGQKHTQKPDKDNLEKALLDCIYDEDCAHWWSGPVFKIWGDNGSIAVISDGPKEWTLEHCKIPACI
jgi:hypothetical protein